jgi:hypothetical protein
MHDIEAGVRYANAVSTTLAQRMLQDGESPRRTGRWALACATAIGSGIYVTLSGGIAYTEPVVDDLYTGAAYVAMSSPVVVGGSGRFQIMAVVDEEIRRTQYVLHFDKASVGRRFAITLTGTAVLNDAMINSASDTNLNSDRPVTAPIRDCRPSGSAENGPCQTIHGVVPSSANYSSSDDDKCSGPYDDWPRFELNGDTDAAVERLDWAHRMVHGVELEPVISFKRRGNETVVNNVPLGKGLQEVESDQSCSVIQVDTTRLQGQQSTRPTSIYQGSAYVWKQAYPDISGPNIITTGRQAEQIAVYLVGSGAALIGLGVGLLPVTVDAARDNARTRRRRTSEIGW